jgi:heptosyltransferase-3
MQNEKTTAPAPHHITIIHTGAIGDLLQTGPFLGAVRAKWPEARVTLVGRPERGRLLKTAGLVDATVDAETCGLWRLLGDSKGPLPRALVEADLVLDLLGLTAQGVAVLRGRVVRLEPLPSADWGSSAAEWLLGQAREALKLTAAAPEPVLAVPEAVREAARKALAAKGIRGAFAAIHPGSGSTKKNWPMERFAEVARRLREETGRAVAWLLGPAETERGIQPDAGGGAVLADLVLETVAGILTLADGYVGNDSGVTQLAAAVRGADGRATPTVALFGPTDARVWAPRGRHVRLVRSADGTMDAIAVKQVWSAVRAAIGEVRRPAKNKPRD